MAEPQKLKVFISWSGALSRGVALALRDWLPVVFDNVQPWASEADIEPGQRGLSEIEKELAGTSFGLIIVTQENQHSTWLNFEAGALSKAIPGELEARIVPLLVDISSPSQVTGPISQFQMRRLNEDGLKSVLISIGGLIGVAPEVVSTRLERNWDDLNAAIGTAMSAASISETELQRSPDDMLDEILTHVRTMRGEMANSLPANWRPEVSRHIARSNDGHYDRTTHTILTAIRGSRFGANLADRIRVVHDNPEDEGSLAVFVPLDFSNSDLLELTQLVHQATGLQIGVTYDPHPSVSDARQSLL